MFFTFVRTNAPPLPGFTCWNSTIRQTPPSSSMCMPFLNSFVLTVSATAAKARWSAAVAGPEAPRLPRFARALPPAALSLRPNPFARARGDEFELALELALARQAARVELSCGDRGPDGAARFGVVRAVVEAAA